MKKTIIIAVLALISCVVLSGCASQASESRASRFKPYSDKVVITLPDDEVVEGRIMPWEKQNIPKENRVFAAVGIALVCIICFLVQLTLTMKCSEKDGVHHDSGKNIKENIGEFIPCFLQISDVRIPLDMALENLGTEECEEVALFLKILKEKCSEGCKSIHYPDSQSKQIVIEKKICDNE